VNTVSHIKEGSDPILLVGGTDPSGAGLQVDWLVTHALGVEASSIVTAVTSQNANRVFDCGVLASKQFKLQLEAIETQTFSAIKIGMLGNEKIIKELTRFLVFQQERGIEQAIIIDPVLTTSSGGELLNNEGITCLMTDLLPLSTLITPNLDELARLTKLPVSNSAEIQIAAEKLLTWGAKSVLVKGGHASDKTFSTDLFVSQSSCFSLQGTRWQDKKNVRGTGCALATAITTLLSKGYCLRDTIVLSKTILSQGIRCAQEIGGQWKLQLKHSKYNDLVDIELQDFPVLHTSNDKCSQPRFLSCGSKSLGIYPVVDSVEWIKKLVPLGIETIQLRIKTDQSGGITAVDIEQQIKEAITICSQYKVRLFINDHWELATKLGAYGIHLGQEDLEKLKKKDLQRISDAKCRLGLSTHSFFEVARAHALKPSYIALGPIFATTSKDMPWIPQGVSAVKMWVDLLGDTYPLVAIGGINIERAQALKSVGVGSVAMITAITEADDYEQATKELLSL